MTILNLTQHKATPEQIAQGVIELPPMIADMIKRASTFDEIPDKQFLFEKARYIAGLALTVAAPNYRRDDLGQITKAMIGGALFFMSALEKALINVGIQPVYAFSVRQSTETQVDGVVTKINTFKHAGFVQAYLADQLCLN